VTVIWLPISTRSGFMTLPLATMVAAHLGAHLTRIKWALTCVV
jgi:hypothetical protein